MTGRMREIRRGDVLLVNLEPAAGAEQKGQRRPCLVVSATELNRIFHGIIVCPIAGARNLKQSELGLTFLPAGEGGLDKNSLVVAFQVRVLDKARAIRKLGAIDERFFAEIDESLNLILVLS